VKIWQINENNQEIDFKTIIKHCTTIFFNEASRQQVGIIQHNLKIILSQLTITSLLFAGMSCFRETRFKLLRVLRGIEARSGAKHVGA
jgi:hypothetical protein